MISRAEIRNFTAFSELSAAFSPGINVLVGANGTGKTHLLKVLYAVHAAQKKNGAKSGAIGKLGQIFRPFNDDVGSLISRRSDASNASIKVFWKDQEYQFELNKGKKSRHINLYPSWQDVGVPVFIPAKEALSFAPGFRSLYNKFKLAFDETYYDIIELAYLPRLRDPVGRELQDIVSKLEAACGGKLMQKEEVFFLKLPRFDLELHLVAEGFRKLALIAGLIENGSIEPGSTIYWDEPESNLNPGMMGLVADVLLGLAKLGVQVFAATHSYPFLKEVSLHPDAPDRVRYFSLFLEGPDGAVAINPADSYLALHPNPIDEEYRRLYDLELDRALRSGSG